MNGVRVFWQQRRIREETRVEKSRKEMKRRKQGYEGRLYPPLPSLSSPKKKLGVVLEERRSRRWAARPRRYHLAPVCRPPLLFPLSSLFFPRVPRDAFGAPCLVIRVIYGALIALRRIATELRRNRSHNYSRTLAYSDYNLLENRFINRT